MSRMLVEAALGKLLLAASVLVMVYVPTKYISAAGVPSGTPGGARPAPQSGVVIVGDPLSDDSPRERQRRVRRAMNAAGRPNEGVRYG